MEREARLLFTMLLRRRRVWKSIVNAVDIHYHRKSFENQMEAIPKRNAHSCNVNCSARSLAALAHGCARPQLSFSIFIPFWLAWSSIWLPLGSILAPCWSSLASIWPPWRRLGRVTLNVHEIPGFCPPSGRRLEPPNKRFTLD